VLGVANIASPSIIPVVFEDGTTANVTTGDVRIQVETEPLVPPDTQVGLAMLVAVSNSRIIQYGSTFIKTEEKNITLEGALQWTMFEYSYSIPWENRTAVDAKALSAEYGKAEYSRKDVGFFKSELAPAQLIELKKLDYVEYIDKKSVVFSENFTDAAKAESEMNTSMSFQPSSLRIVTNSTANLPYPNEAAYIYSIRLNPENYDIPEHLLNVVITSDRQYDYPSATVQVSINGQFIGSTLVTIKEAKITAPSAQ
jgi:hypothetical protein